MPTILNTASTQALPKIALGHCRIKQAWSDPWIFVPWLQPIQTTDMAAPSVGSADLNYYFGRCKLEHETAFSVKTPVTLADYYVQVLCAKEGYPAQVVWTGIIADEATELVGKEVLTGAQRIKAYSMAHLLDRVEIGSSWCKRETGDPFEIQRTLTFNRRSSRGPTVIGNRSDDPDAANEQLYFFSAETSIWTNRNIVEYLLAKYAPEGITWELDGQVELLDELEAVHSLSGSLWDALTKLIDYRRGIGFRVSVQEPEESDEGTVKLFVFSLIDVDVTQGDKTLAKNPNQVPFNYPDTHPYDKMVEPIPLRRTSLTQYDVIEVRASAPLKVCSPFEFNTGALEPGWDTGETEAVYLTPGSVSDFEANDKARSKDKFEGVFTRYRVPKDWLGYVEHTQQTGKAIPKCLDDGTFDEAQLGEFFNRDKRFLRYLPFKVGVDYSVSPPVDENNEDTEPEYLPMAVLYTTAAGKFSFANRLHEDDEDLRSVSFGVLDREMGIQISVSPRHYMALNHWEGAQASNIDPELDYEKISLVGFYETDEWPRIVLKRDDVEDDGSDTPERRLVIVVPGTEVWYCPGSVYDLDATGAPKFIHDDNRFVRDDMDKLRAVAAFAKAWYGVKRQAVTITLHSIGLFVEIGTLITEIASVQTREPVRTVVTGRSINWAQNTTTIETGFDTLDVRGLAGVADSFV